MENYSVLMAVYFKVKPEELELSVSSMVKQTVPPDQFVIVYDGPVGSELKDVIEEYKSNNPGMFTIVQLCKNMGLAYALNQGIEACRNELIARMDSDDYSVPTRCEKQLKEFEMNSNLAILGTGVANFKDTIDNVLPLSKKRPLDNDGIKKMLRRSSPFAHSSVMYKKSAVKAVGGYDPELRRRQDYDLFSKMINSYKFEAANLEEKLLYFRAEDGFVSRNKNIESCKSRLLVQKRILMRGECSVFDYLYIWFAMIVSMILPDRIYCYILMKIQNR